MAILDHNRRGGFTIIEMLISLPLALIVAGSAYAALRVASQAVTTATRLSLENTMLRDGALAANDDLDFWTSYDDPSDPTNRRLRGSVDKWWSDDGRGMPFTPFAALTPSGEPVWERQDAGVYDDRRGWDPSESWSAADPKTWWRGHLAQRKNFATLTHGGLLAPDLRSGHYGIFANIERRQHIRCDPHTTAAGHACVSDYGDVGVKHTWLANQQRGLLRSLGYYGIFDYLPPNQVIGWHEAYDAARTDPGGVPTGFLMSEVGWPVMWNGRNVQTQMDRFGYHRDSFSFRYVIAPSYGGGDLGTLMEESHRMVWRLAWAADSYAALLERIANARDRLPLRPTHWPAMNVSMARFLSQQRMVAWSTVRVTSPVTGDNLKLSFTGFGTSLRGARQQRRPAGGWAAWDNRPGAINDATLDGQQ